LHSTQLFFKLCDKNIL